ncbi:MAG: hypothetical protein H6865_01900 [Rhodospirillales bacterium]|nr:hypothetical protein [Alphaproteobacteria bacterium]MCB9986372.1 hypothetical protein [Rhodospirillales bacterium]USO07079.1 MAG: hypothetical protein H6866_06485 [Rhodospirillales bacterium]
MAISALTSLPATIPAAQKSQQAAPARAPDHDGDADDRAGAVDTDRDAGGRVDIKA